MMIFSNGHNPRKRDLFYSISNYKVILYECTRNKEAILDNMAFDLALYLHNTLQTTVILP